MKKTRKRKTAPTKSKRPGARRYRQAPRGTARVAEPKQAAMAPRVTTPAEWEAMSPDERLERNRRAAALIRSWMDDNTGYDEEVWPALEQALKEDPIRFREDV
jgi:hypothetical protein